jgi:hypothetical protein
MKKFWKIYFYLFCVLEIIEFIMRACVSYYIAGTFYFSNSNWFNLLVSLAGCFGLYGFVFRKKILIKEIWKLFLIFIMVDLLWSFYDLAVSNPFFQSEIDFIDFSFSGIAIIVFFPFCVAIYRYGFKSNELWGIKAI